MEIFTTYLKVNIERFTNINQYSSKLYSITIHLMQYQINHLIKHAITFPAMKDIRHVKVKIKIKIKSHKWQNLSIHISTAGKQAKN